MLASRMVTRSNALGDSVSSKAPSVIAARYDDSQSLQRRRQRPAILIRRDSIRSFSLPAPLTLFRRSGTLLIPCQWLPLTLGVQEQRGPATASLRALRETYATRSTAAYMYMYQLKNECLFSQLRVEFLLRSRLSSSHIRLHIRPGWVSTPHSR